MRKEWGEKTAKNLSAAALLNKYRSTLHNANSLISALIKVDCWLNENRLQPRTFCLFPDPGSWQISSWFADFSLSTVSVNLGPVKLAWERRVSGGSRPNLWGRAPVSLQPGLSVCQKAAPHSPYLFLRECRKMGSFNQNDWDRFRFIKRWGFFFLWSDFHDDRSSSNKSTKMFSKHLSYFHL